MARDKIVPIRYSEDELLQLQKLKKQSRLSSNSEFIRQASLHSKVKPPPPPELVDVLKALLRENQAWGNNLNQLAHISNASGYSLPDDFKAMQEEQKNLGAALIAALRQL
ncbi:MAG TPA: plasmid mobilization relaxosome protein MobC [Clostridia bacterium]|nr:plasmid mobilization relaxosome protein MobC [Clostridia bacterium]